MFLAALGLYELGWSSLFPLLSASSIVFLMCTIAASALLGVLSQGLVRSAARQDLALGRSRRIVIGLTAVALIEIAYDPNTPLVLSLVGAAVAKSYVTDYGLPLVHPFLCTFSSFYAVRLFDAYLLSKQWQHLALAFACIAILVVFFVRGQLAITFMAALFVFMYRAQRIRLKTLAVGGFVCALGIYGFGWAGNLRLADKELILDFGGASGNFVAVAGDAASELFWGYLYLTSPIANFQENLDARAAGGVASDRRDLYSVVAAFANFELLPDLISKRISPLLELQPEGKADLVSPALTVGTLYADAYSYLGWIGPTIMFFWFVILTFVFLSLLKPSGSYYLVGLGFWASAAVLTSFDNMLVHNAILLPIIYAIWLDRRVPRSKSKRPQMARIPSTHHVL